MSNYFQQYAPLFVKAGRRAGLPAGVALAQINQESGFNPGAGSSAGAEGIAQFMPGTFAEYGKGSPWNPGNAANAYTNLMGALMRQYHNIPEALSAYNSGSPTAYLNPNFAKGQTYNYVRDIMAAAPRFGSYKVAQGGAAALGPTSLQTSAQPGQPVLRVPGASGSLTGLAGAVPPNVSGAGRVAQNVAPGPSPAELYQTRFTQARTTVANQLLAAAQQLSSGGTPNLANLFAAAKNFQQVRLSAPKAAPLGAKTPLARSAAMKA